MAAPLVICIPGPWKDKKELLTRIISETAGEYVFLGMVLAQPNRKRHVELEFCRPSPELEEAFRIGGQGALSKEVLDQVQQHQSIALLRFDVSFRDHRQDVIDFTRVLQRVGGIAVKLESSGVAHSWPVWFERIESDNPFDWYRSFVVLIGDAGQFYSCGMHLFDLPDVEVSRELDPGEAADVMNRFNYWQIVESPKLAEGETFSVTADAPRFILRQLPDTRHQPQTLFHNARGLWRLESSEVRRLH